MSLPLALAVLRARWRLALAVFAAVALSALLAAVLQPRQFHAKASVVLDVRPDPVSAAAPGPASVSALMATQVDIVRSDRVSAAALSRLSPDDRRKLRAEWAPSADGDAAADRALRAAWADAVMVEPARDSTVLSIGFDAQDATLAAALANAAAQAYLDITLQLRIEPARRFARFFETQTEAARARLGQAQSRQRDFQARHGLVMADGRLDLEATRLADLSTRLTAAQADSTDATSRELQARSDRADRLPEVLNHPLLTQLKAEIGRAEARHQQLATRLGDRHPQLLEAQAQVQELRLRLAEESRRVSAGVGVSERIQRQRESGLRAALSEQRGRVLALESVRQEAQLLQREVDQAQRELDALEQRLQQSSLESASTQGRVNLLSPATVPIEASSPQVALQGVLGLALGAVLAVSIVLALELRDRRAWGADDVESALGLPLLVSIPVREPRGRLAAPLLRRVGASPPGA